MDLVRRLVRWLYRRLGRRYARIAVLAEFFILHLIVLGGVALLTLYQRVPDGRLWAIIGFTQGAVLLDNAFHLRVASGELAPVDRWQRGERGPAASAAAWRAIAGLPLAVMERCALLSVVLNIVPAAAFITLELHLRWIAAPAIGAGGLVVVLYGALARYYALELLLRPLLEDMSEALPGGVEPAKVVPLRLKLLATLPAINIVTGVVAAGLSQRGHAHLSNLGVDVLIAVVVAFTLSLELTVLLSRSLLEPIEDLRRATLAVAAGDYTVRVPVISSDETGALAVTFNRMVAGLQERERLHEAFGTFVDPGLADRVLSEGAVLSGQEVAVSVLFVDIRNFTAFAERAEPSEVVAQLNSFFDLIVPPLVTHGGHANKFIGDGLLGVFGAPEPLIDHADRAVAAALEIVELSRARYGERAIGVGVNSGTVVAGTVGGGGRLEFTVIGDVVNTASRVEAATRQTGDELLITGATRDLLRGDRGAWEQRPAVELKGKREPVRLFAPVRAPGAVPSVPAALK
ncbi:MAG TPA: adenylate/guanylate cyclase domain-containing protein [Solirubrobacteraceae bacterium]|nr:adenylate/guanylate cyclase domain-containing protein [Solirubrobacteraceae bacterium]